MEKVTMYTRRMAVAYETETPHATRTELGPYREADYLELPESRAASFSTAGCR